MSPPNVARIPLVVVQREAIGLYTLQTWRAPQDGWIPLTEVLRFPNFDLAVTEQTRRVAHEGGAIVSVLDVPNWKRPDFGGGRRG